MATDTMLAVVKTHPEQGVDITRVDVPGCRPHAILVRLQATSVCGTDVHIYNWNPWAQARLALPRILGHEAAGEVVAVGTDVQGSAFATWYKAARFLQSGLLDPSPIITHRFPLAEFDQAMHLIAHGECGKVLLRP